MKALKAKILSACIMLLAIMLPAMSHATILYDTRAIWEVAAGSFADVDISYIPEFSTLTAGTPVALPAGAAASSVSFSTDLARRQVPGSWATWSGGQTPAVLWEHGYSVTGTFSSAVQAFGFEMEPDPFAKYIMTMLLSDGSSIPREVDGYAGAQFLGWAAGSSVVSFTMSCEGCDFAFGRMVTATAVPEPSTLLLLGSGMVGLALTRIRKFRKNA